MFDGVVEIHPYQDSVGNGPGLRKILSIFAHVTLLHVNFDMMKRNTKLYSRYSV